MLEVTPPTRLRQFHVATKLTSVSLRHRLKATLKGFAIVDVVIGVLDLLQGFVLIYLTGRDILEGTV